MTVKNTTEQVISAHTVALCSSAHSFVSRVVPQTGTWDPTDRALRKFDAMLTQKVFENCFQGKDFYEMSLKGRVKVVDFSQMQSTIEFLQKSEKYSTDLVRRLNWIARHDPTHLIEALSLVSEIIAKSSRETPKLLNVVEKSESIIDELAEVIKEEGRQHFVSPLVKKSQAVQARLNKEYTKSLQVLKESQTKERAEFENSLLDPALNQEALEETPSLVCSALKTLNEWSRKAALGTKHSLQTGMLALSSSAKQVPYSLAPRALDEVIIQSVSLAKTKAQRERLALETTINSNIVDTGVKMGLRLSMSFVSNYVIGFCLLNKLAESYLLNQGYTQEEAAASAEYVSYAFLCLRVYSTQRAVSDWVKEHKEEQKKVETLSDVFNKISPTINNYSGDLLKLASNIPGFNYIGSSLSAFKSAIQTRLSQILTKHGITS